MDDGQDRGDDVGAVKTAAEAYFNDRHIDLLLSEIVERHGGGQFKEGRVERLEKRPVLSDEVNDVLFAHALAVDADALTEIDKVGRGEQSCAITC